MLTIKDSTLHDTYKADIFKSNTTHVSARDTIGSYVVSLQDLRSFGKDFYPNNSKTRGLNRVDIKLSTEDQWTTFDKAKGAYVPNKKTGGRWR